MFDKPRSRKDAMASGVTRYFTGRPCLRGHVDFRTAVKGMCCACSREKAAARYSADPSAASSASRRWREKNPDYADKNRARINENSARYRRANLDKCASLRSMRRAREKSAVPGWFGELDRFAIAEAQSLAKARSSCTGVRWEVDHVYPLAGKSVCGLHCASNIQVVPMQYNRRKSNRLPVVAGHNVRV